MKIYINTFDLAQPMARKITVAPYSTFGIGVKVLLNGQPTEIPLTLEIGSTPITAESDLIDGYTIFKVSSNESGNVQYNVKCAGQTFYLTQTVNGDAGSFEIADEGGGSSTKYGISMDSFLGDVDANGVLQVPTNTSLEFVSDEILSIQNPASLNFLKGNTQLTKIDLSNLTTVGDQALATVFQNCTALAEVNLPSLSSIGDYGMVLAFSGCTSLTHVTLPAITSLSASSMFGGGQMNQTFKGCTSLQYVSIPNLTSISAGCMTSTFQGCTGLKYLDLSSLSSIEQQGADDICSGCTALQFVDFRNATAVPTNTGSASSRAKQVWFPSTNDTFKVIVPDELYDSWISNYWWETMASQIVKASEYPVVMTPYTGYDIMDNN